MIRQNIFEGHAKLLTILCGPWIGCYQGRKFLYWSWSNWPLAALQREWGTSVQPLKKPTANGKLGTNIQVLPRKLAAKNFSKYLVSPSMFHLNSVESGKDDSSLEAHLKSSKTRLLFSQRSIHFCQNLNSISGSWLEKGIVVISPILNRLILVNLLRF